MHSGGRYCTCWREVSLPARATRQLGYIYIYYYYYYYIWLGHHFFTRHISTLNPTSEPMQCICSLSSCSRFPHPPCEAKRSLLAPKSSSELPRPPTRRTPAWPALGLGWVCKTDMRWRVGPSRYIFAALPPLGSVRALRLPAGITSLGDADAAFWRRHLNANGWRLGM
ncbi:hypothetical protein BJ875DRAFT_212876 [Amylocarpus encephaloides]|uniref:Uncharacterized protein n=1 Tax=Amylocarpus encephaloides TaxID=45428 RepID=A0A9P7YPB4_9HELO|nr:hypothetical protein BJ875DRAFT_212876 [Amylocarpus encephaloides]